MRQTMSCGLMLLAAVAFASPVRAQGYFNTSAGGNPYAQAQSMFNSALQSMSGGSSFGSPTSTSFGSTGSGMGGTGMGSTGRGGAGGFGNTGTGGMGQGMGGQTGFGNTGLGGQGNNGFLGANNNPNSFLGRNAQGQQTNFNQNMLGNRGGRGGNRGFDQELQQLLNGGGQYGGNNQNNRNTGVRPRQKVAFDHPTLRTPVVVTGLQTRFEKLGTRYPHLKSVNVAVGDDGVVVLRGEVDSHNSAKVTESLVRLEPGVKIVRNELTYPPPAAAE